MKLSVIIPVYNERDTIEAIIERVKNVDIEKEIIVVDDGSFDGTREILEKLKKEDPSLKVLFHPRNKGKGAAIRHGFRHAQGELVVIQDADLEYDPQEYHELLKPIISGHADMVFGSRLSRAKPQRAFLLWHLAGNKVITLLANILYNTTLSDIETCYKAFTTAALKSLNLKSNGFEIEPEITAKVFKKRYRVYEVPISYYGRGYDEGKKIGWIDGIKALWTLVKYRFVD